MNLPGESDLLTQTRAALLDALEALIDHKDAVIVVGAQAVYLRTGDAPVALAEATKDSDLALDPRLLSSDPLLEEAMDKAGFFRNPFSRQPGAWMNAAGIPVDLMVPEELAGAGGKQTRGARIPPHDKGSTRRARGLEAAVVDKSKMVIDALDDADGRNYEATVAGPAALLVAKLHKIAERTGTPDRLNDKDAHDIYRLLIATQASDVADTFRELLNNEISQSVTADAVEMLGSLFADGPQALGSMMAGRAEEGIGNPENVSLSVSLLAADILGEMESKSV